jgi:ubiquinol-cytochrome c reductase cytochrome b subunit
MRILKSHPLLKLLNGYLVDASQPSNISYLWNFGSLLAVCLIIQIATGVTLAMHYSPNVLEAFNSIEHIMRDVNNGWLIRYLHSNTASAFFFLVYLHIGRGLYYGSYRSPRTLVWALGTVILIAMIGTAFLGYVLPYGQMSLWGATVITNLISAIPWIGQDVVEFIWGGFSVNNATLNRFFALHYLLPFVLAALVLMHLIALHDTAGSSNPLGISGNYDRIPFAPYFLFKDLVTIFIFFFVLSIFVFFMPNVLGDSDNYIMANPMQTPPAIVPEWYLLPFYAILRSIPNKLLGVIAMFGALVIIMILPITDLGRSKGLQFRPLSKIVFYIFVANFLVLLQLGAKHVESPFIEFGQISTVLYFAHFTVILPLVSLLENTLVDLSLGANSKSTSTVRWNLSNYTGTTPYNIRKFSTTRSINMYVKISMFPGKEISRGEHLPFGDYLHIEPPLYRQMHFKREPQVVYRLMQHNQDHTYGIWRPINVSENGETTWGWILRNPNNSLYKVNPNWYNWPGNEINEDNFTYMVHGWDTMPPTVAEKLQAGINLAADHAPGVPEAITGVGIGVHFGISSPWPGNGSGPGGGGPSGGSGPTSSSRKGKGKANYRVTKRTGRTIRRGGASSSKRNLILNVLMAAFSIILAGSLFYMFTSYTSVDVYPMLFNQHISYTDILTQLRIL